MSATDSVDMEALFSRYVLAGGEPLDRQCHSKLRRTTNVANTLSVTKALAKKLIDFMEQRLLEERADQLQRVLLSVPPGAYVLDTRSARCTARTLGDAEHLVARAEASSGWMEAVGDVWFGSDTGGTVSASYGYPAECDYLWAARCQGRTFIAVTRGKARARPTGEFSTPAGTVLMSLATAHRVAASTHAREDRAREDCAK